MFRMKRYLHLLLLLLAAWIPGHTALGQVEAPPAGPAARSEEPPAAEPQAASPGVPGGVEQRVEVAPRRSVADRLWRFGGRLHPMVVHFPIALLIAACFTEFFRLRGGRC